MADATSPPNLGDYNKQLQDLFDMLSQVGPAVEQAIMSSVEKIPALFERANKGGRKFKRNLDDIVRSIDGHRGLSNTLSKLEEEAAKKFDGLGSSMESFEKVAEESTKNLEKFIRSGRLNRNEMNAANFALTRINSTMGIMRNTTKGTVKEYDGLRKAIGDAVKMSRTMMTNRPGGMIRSGLSDIRDTFRAGGLYMHPSRMEKYAAIGRQAAMVKSLTEMRNKKHADILKQNMSTAASKAEKGSDEYIKLMHGRSGGLRGYIDTRLGRMATKSALANTMLGRGGGSVLRGVGSTVLGAGESVVSKAGSFIGEVAVPLAALELVKMAFDKTAVMNQELQQKLGPGGLLSNLGVNGAENFRTVQRQLMVKSPYNIFGLNYDKNLAVASQMVGLGYNTPELFNGARGRSNTSLGSLIGGTYTSSNLFGSNLSSYVSPGATGAIQALTTIGGRVAGFSSEQSVDQIVKLITTYNQSLADAGDFFIQLNKDSQAAGISTLKYVQILDSVTSGFDDLHKSMNQVMGTMRVLSSSGISSVEDVKDYMEALTDGGKQRSLPLSTYLYMQMRNSPSTMSIMGQSRQAELNRAIATANKALGADTINLALSNNPTMPEIYKLRRELSQKGTGMDVKAASSALNGVFAALQQQQAFRSFSRHPGAAGALGMATFEQSSNDEIASILSQISGIQSALGVSGHTMREFINNPGAVLSDIKFNQMGQLLGLDMSKVNRMPEVAGLTSNAIVKALTSPTEGQQSFVANWLKNPQHMAVLKAIGFSTPKGQSIQVALQSFLQDQKDGKKRQDDLYMAILGMTDTLKQTALLGTTAYNSIGDKERLATFQQAETAAMASTPTADVFAHAFEYLFMQIIDPLEKLVDILSGHWGSKATPELDAAAQSALDASKKYLPQMQIDMAAAYTSGDIQKANQLKDVIGYINSGIPMSEMGANQKNMLIANASKYVTPGSKTPGELLFGFSGAASRGPKALDDFLKNNSAYGPKGIFNNVYLPDMTARALMMNVPGAKLVPNGVMIPRNFSSSAEMIKYTDLLSNMKSEGLPIGKILSANDPVTHKPVNIVTINNFNYSAQSTVTGGKLNSSINSQTHEQTSSPTVSTKGKTGAH